MGAPRADEYEFTCTQCGERFEVNDSMRDALLERGCPICGSATSENEFATLSP
ncbi:zinc ribbon domain-containing protein [Haloferax mediterranei ATCC 33500]|uniref:Zinc ribbon domain-containing protein n=1 Tax=Haloferax mediterranei (strain ATCC 33500 / DSM 1411 / JCM 8866 / NBRC 14739 / NCIMB 2177 / R-4) TaxID=523841 RepID=I3R1T0_HALMT|nr:FmdB family zinc ribbon protein [Haloferax mediterranei]AFK18190.1 hypothetical protein HFX_0455 [Haloferax mediterranei ATCC 33500]EMA02536.1 hypothetical protein C439_08135 [Haloferax mediterranei ATCC 33500]MDX5988280.1 FmdB family zinc ribbon protein [Haloferax mediterranei ATCC 33500]QCQ74718.1 zinc ribbon domain-containing protein [Haloferax mediterranei ATCC 33500]